MIFLYLGAIIAANLLAAHYGAWITPYVAFALIGCDLVARDRLHERWHHDHLVERMAVLIATGSVLSWLLNRNAGPIALASCLAFGAAAVTDTLMYSLLRRQSWLVRSNGSNIPAAVVDSIVFLFVAFGVGGLAFAPLQVAAKIGGGVVWSVVLQRRRAVA